MNKRLESLDLAEFNPDPVQEFQPDPGIAKITFPAPGTFSTSNLPGGTEDVGDCEGERIDSLEDGEHLNIVYSLTCEPIKYGKTIYRVITMKLCYI